MRLNIAGGRTIFYQEGRVVRFKAANGSVIFFDKNGCIVRIEQFDGTKLFYVGEKDSEHLVRAEHPLTEVVSFYEGRVHKEYIVREAKTVDGTTMYTFFEVEDNRVRGPFLFERPKITWATYRKRFKLERLAWYWCGLSGRPGGKVHAEAVSSYEEDKY